MSWIKLYRIEHTADPSECHGLIHIE